MRKRWLVCCMALVGCLFMLSGCKGSLENTQWDIAGYVDEAGNDVAKADGNGAFSGMGIAFFEGDTGSLRVAQNSYPFSYKEEGDHLAVTLQDGRTAQIRSDDDILYLTLGDTTLIFHKRQT